MRSTSLFQQRRVGADTGVVDQRRDVGVFTQHFFNAGKIGRIAQIGGKHFNHTTRLVRYLRGERLQLVPVSGYKDQVITARG